MFFVSLPSDLMRTEIRSNVMILGTLLVHLTFAANVFFVLLFLHFAQWLVSVRLRKQTEALNPQVNEFL